MILPSMSALAQQRKFFSLCKLKEWSAQRSSQPPTSTITKIAAAGLVLASSGFGGAYAWQAGAHSALVIGGVPLLACLAVLMALSLEIAKPYAVANCLALFRDWQPVQGGMLAILGLIAVTYSLTSELSLLAMLRSDAAAQRQSAINASTDEVAVAKRQADRFEAAHRELATMAPTRAPGEVQAEIDALLLERGADGCLSVDGPVTKRVCPKVADLRIELARAKRRGQLEAGMASASNTAVSRRLADVDVADPGATALSTYLAALGLVVQPDVVAQWLVLVPVLALEIGSALAGLLAGVSATRDIKNALHPPAVQNRTRRAIEVCSEEPATLPADGDLHTRTNDPCTPPNACVVHSGSPGATVALHSCGIVPLGPVRGTSRREAARRILAALHARGGKIDASLRVLANELAVSVGTLRGAIATLALSGEIISQASSSGTAIRLAA